jgi:hypothetical protein
MKNICFVILSAFLSIMCYAQPDWTPVNYTNSTTAYGIVTINGVPATSADIVGVFVGAECRAVGNVILSGGVAYVTLLIQGEEVETASFQVWDADVDVICDVAFTVATSPGGTIGFPPDYLQIAATSSVNNRPIANAGVDQTVDEGDTGVELDGSASSDPDGDDITYLWTAPAGITLSDATIANPTFDVPASPAASYEFTLVVNDGLLDSDPDVVIVNITPTGIDYDLLKKEIKVFPNPAYITVYVEMPENANCICDIILTDVLGKKMKAVKNNGYDNFTVDVSVYPAGAGSVPFCVSG